jgi:hypothetical protein
LFRLIIVFLTKLCESEAALSPGSAGDEVGTVGSIDTAEGSAGFEMSPLSG